MSDEAGNGKSPEQEAAEAQLRPMREDPSIVADRIAKRLTEANLDALAGRHGGDTDAFIEKVLISKPCSPVTRRAIDLVTKYANTEIARLQSEHNAAVERVQQEHRSTLEQLAQDAAVSEGIDLGLFQLQAPGDVAPYWKPR